MVMARDTIFRNASDVGRVLDVPVLAVVPTLVAVAGAPPPRTVRSRTVVLAIVIAALVGAGVLAWALR